MSTVTYARLRVTDPGRWRSAALAWRRWAALAGALGAELIRPATRLRSAWSGAAASATTAGLRGLRRRIALFRVLCWRADQALSEFAAALARARELLDRARGRAAGAGLVIDDSGTVHGRSPELPDVVADLSAALGIAADADAEAAARLGSLTATAAHPPPGFSSPPRSDTPPGFFSPALSDAPAGFFSPALSDAPPGSFSPASSDTPPGFFSPALSDTPAGHARPDRGAGPAQVRRWWDALPAVERDRLLVTEPATLAGTAGIPAADRDVANRLLLDDRHGRGLDELRARLEDEGVLRPYLMGLDVSGDGRAVVALGDPDRARHVLTHVPGMTSDLESAGGELTRAARVAEQATRIAPAEPVSAVLWLDYDAPDFVHEAWSDRQARDGAERLRGFQEALRVTQQGPPAHHTVLGHSYGSLVVGAAAAGPFAADDVVFVGSPGVGVDSAAQLTVPAWSSTSRTDVIQYAAVAPESVLRDAALAGRVPVLGPVLAFGLPEDDLWFGRNPSDPAFGARIFASQAGAGHLGYWDPGRPALDGLARITVGQDPITRP